MKQHHIPFLALIDPMALSVTIETADLLYLIISIVQL